MEIMNEKFHVIGGLTRHDVGNKLTVIISNVFLLKKQIGVNPKCTRYLEDIDSAVSSSHRLFELSLFYEEIGAEELSKTNVAECFNQASACLVGLGTIRIVNECQGLEVVADSLLTQLFYNLIDNSLKHGEKVTQIQLQYNKNGDGVKLCYMDDGVGISLVNKPKLFEESFSTGEGSGLGLFLIKKMVEVYGWKITKVGETGKGAKFLITIPKVNDIEK
jgi:signal transduction histidine kinase